MTNDRELIEEVKGGSYKSFSLLYDEWASPLYRFAFSLTKSDDMSQDIVQETFVRVWSNRLSLDSTHSFKSYLFTISYHLAVKEFHRILNHPRIADYMDYCDSVTAKGEETDRLVDFNRFLEELDKAKQKLTPRQREIFEMNKEANLSIGEIAEKLAINEQTVRNQLSSALKVVRKELNDYSFLLSLLLLA